jgi:hypothetical protein
MKMTNEDIIEYRKNAIDILKKNDQHATAKAVDIAFSSLIVLEQIRWERDIALAQLEELGISFGEKIDGKYLTKEEYNQLLKYKDYYEELCDRMEDTRYE